MGFITKNLDYVRDLLIKTKTSFNLTNKDIVDILANNKAFGYKEIEKSAYIATGDFIPYMTLAQFYECLDPDIEENRGGEIRLLKEYCLNFT
jgi:hypothetical protein